MKKMMTTMMIAMTCATSAFAQEAAPAPALPTPPQPSADEIRRVTQYYLNGVAGGPVLLDFLLCTKVVKGADSKLICESEYGATAKKGDAVSAFLRFFAPKGGKYEDLRVKFVHNGELRKMDDLTVTESWTGSATYKTVSLSKPGSWEIQVTRGDVVLGSKTLTVQ
jgi:hypothetical protein